MKTKEKFNHFVLVFVIAFISAAIVTYLYSFIVYGIGIVNWELSIVLGIVLGIIRVFGEKK